MEKIKQWFQTYGGYVLAGILAVLGFLVGREFPRRTDVDPERLRQRIGELRGQLAEAKDSIDRLERLNGELAEQSQNLRDDIESAERTSRIALQYSDSTGDDLENLRAIRDRLADLADRYAESAGKD